MKKIRNIEIAECPRCRTEIEPGFDVCWKCGYNLYGKNDDQQQTTALACDLPCLRCGTQLVYTGNYKFHEGTRWGFFSNAFELLVNKVSLDTYLCPKCGKMEFYDPNIRINR
jgi:predicted RNA-binding Zn-ribbon protein involved in translation (DUF1610 family)